MVVFGSSTGGDDLKNATMHRLFAKGTARTHIIVVEQTIMLLVLVVTLIEEEAASLQALKLEYCFVGRSDLDLPFTARRQNLVLAHKVHDQASFILSL